MKTQITHLRKKGNRSKEDYTGLVEKLNQGIDTKRKLNNFLKKPGATLFHVSKDELLACNALKYKGHNLIFPEPNPVAFYYSLAVDALTGVSHSKNLLEQYYKDKSKLEESYQSSIVIFSYLFKASSVSIIFAFLAIEATFNQIIPDDYETIRKNRKLNKYDIQRSLTFYDKYDLITKIRNKNFAEKFPKKYEIIKSLKELRDELIHLKNNEEKSTTYYNNIYQKLLMVDLVKTVKATKDLINYYQKETIVEGKASR